MAAVSSFMHNAFNDIIFDFFFWHLSISCHSNLHLSILVGCIFQSDTQQVSNASGVAGAGLPDLLFGF